MANDCFYYLSVKQINEAGADYWDKLPNRLTAVGQYMGQFVELLDLPDGFSLEKNPFVVGAKWAYIEDWVSDGFAGVSANAAPVEGAELLTEMLGKFDKNVVVSLEWEDTGMDPAGRYLFFLEPDDPDDVNTFWEVKADECDTKTHYNQVLRNLKNGRWVLNWHEIKKKPAKKKVAKKKATKKKVAKKKVAKKR